MGRTAVIFFFLLFITTGTAPTLAEAGFIDANGNFVNMSPEDYGAMQEAERERKREAAWQEELRAAQLKADMQSLSDAAEVGRKIIESAHRPSPVQQDRVEYQPFESVSQEWSPPPENRAGGEVLIFKSTVKGIAKMADGTPVGLSGFEPKKPAVIPIEEKVEIQADDSAKQNFQKEHEVHLQKVLISR